MEFKFSMNIVQSGSNTRLEIIKVFKELLEQAGFDLRPSKDSGQKVTAILDTEQPEEIRLLWPKHERPACLGRGRT